MASHAIFCHDFGECINAIVALIRSAKKTIRYSTFLCLLNVKFPGWGELTLCELLHEATSRGVQVELLYNPSTSYGNISLSEFHKMLPKKKCKLFVCEGSGNFNGIELLFSPHGKFSYHHQKWLCVDDKWAMITGCDVDNDRMPWGQVNKNNFLWHELSVVVPCTPKMARFFHRNLHRISSPPLPLIQGEKEHSVIKHLIYRSKKFIHMEQQMFVSTENTHNNIARCIVDRIFRAITHNEEYYFVLITNVQNNDETKLLDFFLRMLLNWSVRWMEQYALSLGITLIQLYSHLFIGYLKIDNVFVKVHSNITICDSEIVVRSSSNMSDRSLSKFPCDTEIGIIITDKQAIIGLLQKIWQRYMKIPNVQHNIKNVFYAAKKESGCFKEYKYFQYNKNSNINISFHTLNTMMTLIHESKMFGNKQKINWSIRNYKKS
jgi:phosphatidylserine/phosphatidylglycerophosphate/cardiolipin synthase-like enzyme